MSTTNQTFLGILAGTAIGATLGILFAPDKGTKTREKIAKETKHIKDQIVNDAMEVQHTLSDTMHTKKETLDSKIESLVSDASYKADDIITSLEKKLQELKIKNKKLQKS